VPKGRWNRTSSLEISFLFLHFLDWLIPIPVIIPYILRTTICRTHKNCFYEKWNPQSSQRSPADVVVTVKNFTTSFVQQKIIISWMTDCTIRDYLSILCSMWEDIVIVHTTCTCTTEKKDKNPYRPFKYTWHLAFFSDCHALFEWSYSPRRSYHLT